MNIRENGPPSCSNSVPSSVDMAERELRQIGEANRLKQLLGKCGFCCACCPTYIKGGCMGCMEEHRPGDCYTRDCVLKQGLPCCGACERFPCEVILTQPHATVLSREWLRWKKESGTNR